MDKTIEYLENKGFLQRLRKSTALAEVVCTVAEIEFPEVAKKKACKDLIMNETAKDKDLLNAILNDVTDEIIKHI